tara:strand:+ start:4357 stop:5163 length:807 start_codon:yes stop_codon:yes gene_type:complete
MISLLLKNQEFQEFFYNNVLYESFLNKHKWYKESRFFKKLEQKLNIEDLYKKHLSFENELLQDHILEKHWNNIIKKFNIFGKKKGDVTNYKGVINDFLKPSLFYYYSLIRIIKPKNILETGVAAGISSSLILSALKKNNLGKLTSIDLPPKTGMAPSRLNDNEVGCLIPKNYYSQWNFIQGDAKKKLTDVLISKKPEIFIHDSLHDYSHMMFEYISSWSIMGKNKIILSDDILLGIKKNKKAWFDFLKITGLEGIGNLKKENFGITFT